MTTDGLGADRGAQAPAVAEPIGRELVVGAVRRRAAIARFLAGWGLPVALYIGLFVTLEIVGLIAFRIGPREPFAGDWQALTYTGPFSELLSIWQRWDALWYQHIAETGYRAGETAFFPLYPLLGRVASLFFVGNTVLGLLAVSGAAFVGAIKLLGRLVRTEARSLVAGAPAEPRPGYRVWLPLLTILLVATFPTAFFLVAPFTEALFLLLVVASLYFARTGRPWLAGASGFLASLTRAQGVFLTFSLVWEHLLGRGTLAWVRGRGGRPPGVELLAALLPALGTVNLIVFQRVVLGEQKTGFEVLSAWGYRMVAPWDAVSAAWTFIKSGHAGPGQAEIELFNVACLVGFTLISIVGARRLALSYWLYAWPSLGLLLTRSMYFSPIMSTARYVVVLFPCFMVVALWLAPRPRLAAFVLVVGFVAQLVMFQYFVRWGFVG